MIISGKELSAQLKAEMAAQVATFPEKYGRVPHLVVILVGEDPGSVSYDAILLPYLCPGQGKTPFAEFFGNAR